MMEDLLMETAALHFKLRQVARSGTWTTAPAIAPIAGVDLATPEGAAGLARLLAAIDQNEEAAGRPLLSAVVVTSATGLPHPGFFTAARALGLHAGSDDRVLWERELLRVHTYWARQ
jgi:UPF0716 family protein affecting phage T7 exclusion